MEFLSSPDLTFAVDALERAYQESLRPSRRTFDRTWALVQVIAWPLFLAKIWTQVNWNTVAAVVACWAAFWCRFCAAHFGWTKARGWLRMMLILATDAAHLLLGERTYHLYMPPPTDAAAEVGLHRGRLALRLSVGNPAFFLGLLTFAARLPFRQHMVVHTISTIIVLGTVHKHCQLGSGFEVAYRWLLGPAPLAHPAAAASSCTTIQVLAVVGIGYVLPSTVLYLAEWRSRRRFLLAVGHRGDPAAAPAPGSASLVTHLCDGLLLLLPLAAMLASLALNAPMAHMLAAQCPSSAVATPLEVS